ncbi:Hypothetical predicted protein [Cloeon dipterum]|uniref:Uncharacterized protein n=1 Tax=Cloeon dipterum TaxID=197152 RepID=A0A8S1DNL5_9INSE|nr:Hypothetical predicted protein [Cloeon dipterum]
MAMMDREEEFLSNFFNSVSHLSFDKAKECLDRSKDDTFLQSPTWNLLISALSQFAAAEKSYVDLGFFARQKSLFKIKDNSLRSVYEHLRMEIKKIDTVSREVGNKTIAAVASQLEDSLKARIELIEFYELMQGVGCSKPVKFCDLLGSLEHIVERHDLACPHLSLTWLKAAHSLECEVLLHLVRAGAELAEWRFLPSLMLLHGAHTRLVAWETSLGARSSESWRLGSFLTSTRLPLLHQWLVKMKSGLSAKFALLFYNTLLQQTTASDIKALCAKLTPAVDFAQRLQSFQHKSGAAAVCIVFDNHGLPDHEGPGYKIPKLQSTPTRLSPSQVSPSANESQLIEHRFAQVFCIPQTGQHNFVEVTGLILESTSELSSLDKIAIHYNQKEQCSIFMINFDPRLTLAAVFNGKKSDKDTMVTTFLLDMAAQLRGNRLLASLKPGSK